MVLAEGTLYRRRQESPIIVVDDDDADAARYVHDAHVTLGDRRKAIASATMWLLKRVDDRRGPRSCPLDMGRWLQQGVPVLPVVGDSSTSTRIPSQPRASAG